MNRELPAFEGHNVQASIARFSGRTAQRVGAFGDGELAVVVAVARVNKISHADFQAQSGRGAPKLYSRIHDLSVTRAVVLPQDVGQPLMDQAISKAGEAFGEFELPFGKDGESSDDTTADESRDA